MIGRINKRPFAQIPFNEYSKSWAWPPKAERPLSYTDTLQISVLVLLMLPDQHYTSPHSSQWLPTFCKFVLRILPNSSSSDSKVLLGACYVGAFIWSQQITHPDLTPHLDSPPQLSDLICNGFLFTLKDMAKVLSHQPSMESCKMHC